MGDWVQGTYAKTDAKDNNVFSKTLKIFRVFRLESQKGEISFFMANTKRYNMVEGACEKKGGGDLGNALIGRDRRILQKVMPQKET